MKENVPGAALTGVRITAPLNPHGQCFGLIPAGGDWLDDLVDWSRRQFKRPEDAQRIAASWNALVHVPLDALIDPNPTPQHPDDTAVDYFAADLKLAMAAGRVQGKSGWDDTLSCNELHLQSLLRAAISKGNPVDVGNYAMMLHSRGERTAHPSAAKLHAALTDCKLKAAMKAVAPAGFADAVRCLNSAFNALEASADSELDHFEDEEEEAEAAPAQFAARQIALALELLYGYGLEAMHQAPSEVTRAPYARRANAQSADKPADQVASVAAEDWRHAANEWADTAYNGLQWLKNIEDGITTDVKAARENLESCCKHSQEVADAAQSADKPASEPLTASIKPFLWVDMRRPSTDRTERELYEDVKQVELICTTEKFGYCDSPLYTADAIRALAVSASATGSERA